MSPLRRVSTGVSASRWGMPDFVFVPEQQPQGLESVSGEAGLLVLTALREVS